MMFQSHSRKWSSKGFRTGRFALQVEHLEGRSQPGSLLPLNEFSMMGQDLFEQDPLGQSVNAADLSVIGQVVNPEVELPQAVSFGVSAASQPIQVAQPVPVAAQPVQSSSQNLWAAANAGWSPAQPTQAVAATPVQAEAHELPVTKLVPNAFGVMNNPSTTGGPTPPGLGVLSYAAWDNSEGIAVAANLYTGDTYVGGSIGTGTEKYALITKYDPAGSPIWSAVFQGMDPELTYVESQINALVFDPSLGVMYAVGTARDANAGDTDQFIMQLYDYGEGVDVYWSYGIGGANDDKGNGVALDPYSYNIYITGDFKLSETATHVSIFGLDYAGTFPPLFAFYYTFTGFTGSSGKGATYDTYTNNMVAVGSLSLSDTESVPLVMGVNGLDGAGVGGLFFNNPDGTIGQGAFISVSHDITDGSLVAAGTVPTDPTGTTGIAAKINADFSDAAWALIYGGTKGFYGVDTDYYGYVYISGTVENETTGDDVLIGQFDGLTGEPVPDQVVAVGGSGSDVGRRLAVSYDWETFLPFVNVAFTTSTEDLLTSDGSPYPTGAPSAAAFARLGGWL